MAASEEPAWLLTEQLSRNTHFLGAERQATLAESCVAVIGMGAVGSHASALLARSGVKRLRFVDEARVEARHLRSHALATPAHIGVSKADSTRRCLLAVVPNTDMQVFAYELSASTAAAVLDGADIALLCVGNDATRLAKGLALCTKMGVTALPCLAPAPNVAESCCEVAHQTLSNIHEVCGSDHARQLIKRLRTELGGAAPMPCASQLLVHSAAATSIGMQGKAPIESDLLSRRGAVLAGLGHALAAAAICQLVGDPLIPARAVMPRAVREDLWKALARRERETFGCADPLLLWPEDVEFVVNSVWGRRCALTGESIGAFSALVLTRWDRRRPAAIDNAVLFTKQEAEKHDRAEDPIGAIEPALAKAIQHTLDKARDVASVYA